MARPVRLALAKQLGADIDGAWWPYSGSLADELPGLIEALHRTLGEIVDICVNWSATEGPRELYEIAASARSLDEGKRRHQRLMVVEGRIATAKLLVVPHMTSQLLGLMMMRFAAARPVSNSQDSQMYAICDSVMQGAQIESASWTKSMRTVAAGVPPLQGV